MRKKEMFKKRLKTAWYMFALRLCRIFCKVFFRMRVYGVRNVPDKGPFVLISNHQSYLDPLFCGTPLRRKLVFLARDTLFANWFLGAMIFSVGTIPIKRGQANLSVMRKIIGKLKDGEGVCLFPEATRTSDGKIAAFRPGFGLLCRRGGAAVVPVVIDGAFESWPRGKKLFSPGGRIVVCYGECISTEQVKNMSDKQLAETLTDTLRRMQNDCRVRNGKEPFEY